MNAWTLYLVKSKVWNLFLNRTYNLIYGKFLKKYDDVEVIYYKNPSNKVNYKKIVDDLWKLKLDEDDEKDKQKNDCVYQHWLIGKAN